MNYKLCSDSTLKIDQLGMHCWLYFSNKLIKCVPETSSFKYMYQQKWHLSYLINAKHTYKNDIKSI